MNKFCQRAAGAFEGCDVFLLVVGGAVNPATVEDLDPLVRQGSHDRPVADFLRPIGEKECYRWLEALAATTKAVAETQVVTVCDREADIYDFFKLSDGPRAPVQVRASQNTTVNRKSRYVEKGVAKHWDYICQQPVAGSYQIEIPQRSKTKHCEARAARTAVVSVRFGSFTMNPPRNKPKHGDERLPDIGMNAVLFREMSPPEGEEPVGWMLLTNHPLAPFDDACERVRWARKLLGSPN